MSDPSASIESLLRLAGERDQPSGEAMSRAREAARLSWRGALSSKASIHHQDRQRAWPFALAAAGLIAVVTATAWWQVAPPSVTVASVAHVEGEASLADSRHTLRLSATLRSGDLLTTGAGRVALTFGDTLSLRVGRDSQLRFEGDGHVTLLEGFVYVDSGGLHRGPALRIGTPSGEIRHVGTQFQVQVRDRLTRVQVREGRVVMTVEGRPALDLAAGDLAELVGGKLRLQRGQPSHGDAWEWAAMSSVGIDIENRPLSEFLAWLAREHGWQLRYSGAMTTARAQEIRLHGSMQGLDAAAMIERVALITGVALTVQDGVLVVTESAP